MQPGPITELAEWKTALEKKTHVLPSFVPSPELEKEISLFLVFLETSPSSEYDHKIRHKPTKSLVAQRYLIYF